MRKKHPGAPLPATCSAVEAAAYLRCSPESIVKMIRAGIIPGAFICRKWVIPADALTAYYAGKIEVPRKRQGSPPAASPCRNCLRRPGALRPPVPQTGKVPAPGTVSNFRNAKIAKPEE